MTKSRGPHAQRYPAYLRKAHKESTKSGWTWEKRAGSNHVIVRDAEGEFVTSLSLTAYDGPVTRKTTGALRKAGCPGIGGGK